MSDQLLGTLITSVIGLVTVGVTGYLALLMAKLNHQAAAASRATVAVAERLGEVTANTVRATTAVAEKLDAVTAGTARATETVAKRLDAANAMTASHLNAIAAVGDKTHGLVNGAMTVQLQLNAAVTRRLAVMSRDEADVRQADLAEKALRDHEAQHAASLAARADSALVTATRANTAAVQANTAATGTATTGNTAALGAATAAITTAADIAREVIPDLPPTTAPRTP